MGGYAMRVGVLTSSRADYSVYLPLLKLLKADSFFDLNIIAFGTHLSEKHGRTVKNIAADVFDVPYQIDTMCDGDSPEHISQMIGKTIVKFSAFWAKVKFDVVIGLGDRFEMFAALTAAVPFNIPIAHIHGGETTTGAIDNVFRHSISLMSRFHFVTADEYKEKLIQLLDSDKNIYNVGALGLDNLKSLLLLSKEEFRSKFNIDLNLPTILSTFHPETIAFEMNEKHMDEYLQALSQLSQYQIVITMPNADTYGNMVRSRILDFAKSHSNVKTVETFGTLGYLTCMNYAEFILGNSSSGFYDASFFPKWVINIGTRQNGRIITPNILCCAINASEILSAVKHIENNKNRKLPASIYGDGHAAEKIVSILKEKANEIR